MSTPPQPPITPGPDEPPSLALLMPAAPPKKSRAGLLLGIAAAVLVAAGLSASAVLMVAADEAPPSVAARPSPSSTCDGYGVDANSGAVVCNPAAPVVNEGPTYAVPTAADFKVTVKILEKQCFGSAGCNITYRISPDYLGAPLDPSVTWLVTYEVSGVEDGPQVNTFEVTGDEASFDAEETASTGSSKAKLTVKVTEILRG